MRIQVFMLSLYLDFKILFFNATIQYIDKISIKKTSYIDSLFTIGKNY